MVQTGRGRVEVPLDSAFNESDGAIHTHAERSRWRIKSSNVRRVYNVRD